MVRTCVVAARHRGASHGWMKTDFPAYTKAAAERGWSALLALFGRALT
jgi:carboxymethylenebutenolidase